jgi:hypothetical protein
MSESEPDLETIARLVERTTRISAIEDQLAALVGMAGRRDVAVTALVSEWRAARMGVSDK